MNQLKTNVTSLIIVGLLSSVSAYSKSNTVVNPGQTVGGSVSNDLGYKTLNKIYELKNCSEYLSGKTAYLNLVTSESSDAQLRMIVKAGVKNETGSIDDLFNYALSVENSRLLLFESQNDDGLGKTRYYQEASFAQDFFEILNKYEWTFTSRLSRSLAIKFNDTNKSLGQMNYYTYPGPATQCEFVEIVN